MNWKIVIAVSLLGFALAFGWNGSQAEPERIDAITFA